MLPHLRAPDTGQLPSHKDANAITEGLSFLHAVCGHHNRRCLLGLPNDIPQQAPGGWVQPWGATHTSC